MLKRIINKFLKINISSSESIENTKRQLLIRILFAINIFGVPLMLVGVTEAIYLDQYLTSILYVVFFSPIFLVAIFWRKLNYNLIAKIVVIFATIVGINNLVVYGFNGAGIPILLTTLVFTTIFLEIRYGLIVVFIGLISMVIIGYLFVERLLSLDVALYEMSTLPISWITASVTLLLLGLMIIMSIGTIQKKLISSNRELQKYQQKLEELVEERTKDLETANKELEAFSYSISHDLRAPLRAIDGFTRILIEDYASKLDKEGKRIGSTIHDNAMKMNKLIDDLLVFSRLGHASMTLTKIDMKNMVKAIYHEVTSAEERKRIKFSVTDLPQVKGDTNLLRQVWINLISNAVKFSSNGKQAIISVTSKEEKNKVTYCIKDNGAGFNMKYVDKLFGVFQRLHSEKDFKGTGIGLSLVKRIIHRHDGNVWAESEIDKSASFFFSLPNNIK